MRKKIRKLKNSLLKRLFPVHTASFPNEAVNFDKQCIFIAVPKTGSTSVDYQLKSQGVPLIKSPHLNIIQVRDLIYVFLLKNAIGKRRSFPTESIASDAELRAQANDIFSAFFKFSGVRNPWARAVSMYFRREVPSIISQMTFEQFCENHFYASDTCQYSTLHKNQFDWLCDENGQCIMDYVYKIENFEEAIRVIDERTDGRVKLSHVHKNYNSRSFSRNYQDIYTEHTKNIIAKRFETDIDFFKYTF